MICPKCGETIHDRTRLCPFCGATISPEEAQRAIEEAERIEREKREAFSAGGVDFNDSTTFSTSSGKDLLYVVIQVTLKEKFLGTGSGNLTELEAVINAQAAKGYRLHTISTTNGGSKGMMGGDRIQATMVFEKLDR